MSEDSSAEILEVESALRSIASNWLTSGEVKQIDPLVPDASGRRYYRLLIEAEGEEFPSTCVAMKFDPGTSSGPMVGEVSGGEISLTPEDAFVTLGRFFRESDINVPQVYVDEREKGFLLLEDFSDLSLGSIISTDRDGFSDAEIDGFFKMALDQIIKIQALKGRGDKFPFNRSFTEEVYFKEVCEFRDFYLSSLEACDYDNGLIEKFFSQLSSELAGCPRFLCHRDFHAWNLHLDAKGQVGVIDFQDALMGPATYDVASFLNDRGTDILLGEERYFMLLESFLNNFNDRKSVLQEYNLCLLQRDLKVVGRFEKLASERQLEKYRKWIPGTLFRIGQTLESIVALNGSMNYQKVLDHLCSKCEKIEEGASKALSFDKLV